MRFACRIATARENDTAWHATQVIAHITHHTPHTTRARADVRDGDFVCVCDRHHFGGAKANLTLCRVKRALKRLDAANGKVRRRFVWLPAANQNTTPQDEQVDERVCATCW